MGIVILLVFMSCRRQLCSLILWSTFFPLQNSFILAVCCLCVWDACYIFLLEFVQFMNAFDRAMNLLDDKFSFLTSTKQIVSSTNNEDKVNMPLNVCIIVIHNMKFFTTASQLRDCLIPRLIRMRLLRRIYTLVPWTSWRSCFSKMSDSRI